MSSKFYNILNFLWKFFKIYCFMLGLSVVFLVILIVISIGSFKGSDFFSSDTEEKKASFPETEIFLQLDLKGRVYNDYPYDPLSRSNFIWSYSPYRISLSNLKDTLKVLADHDMVKEVILNLSHDFAISSNLAMSIFDDLQYLKSKKPLHVYSSNYNLVNYLIAAHGNKIFIPPSGQVDFSSLALSVFSIDAFLDKIGVGFDVIKMGKYKSTGFLKDSKDADRDLMYNSLLDSFVEMITDNFIKIRPNLTSETISQWIAKSLISEYDALDLGVVTDVSHLREAKLNIAANYSHAWKLYSDYSWNNDLKKDQELAEKDLNQESDSVSDSEMADKSDKDKDQDKDKDKDQSVQSQKQSSKPGIFSKFFAGKTDSSDIERIAYLRYKGMIAHSVDESSDDSFGLKEVRKDVRWILESKKPIKAVVVEINSQGGSAQESELIWSELKNLTDAGIKIVAYLQSIATSGGYYIATAADKIMSNKNTITGSIGVIAIIPNVAKLLDRYNIKHTVYSRSNYQDLANLSEELSDNSKEFIQQSINQTYDLFLNRVADNRQITTEQAEKLSQGRVWTGAQAKSIGLVDYIGDIKKAVDMAASIAELKTYKLIFPEKSVSWQECLANPVKCFSQRSNAKFNVLARNLFSNDLASNYTLLDNTTKVVIDHFNNLSFWERHLFKSLHSWTVSSYIKSFILYL